MALAQYIQCKQCLATAYIPAGEDPHARSWCGCCTEDHHHAEAANACPQTHDGPCWQGPQAGPKPDGCTVCRPIVIYGNAAVDLTPSGA